MLASLQLRNVESSRNQYGVVSSSTVRLDVFSGPSVNSIILVLVLLASQFQSGGRAADVLGRYASQFQSGGRAADVLGRYASQFQSGGRAADVLGRYAFSPWGL